MKSLNTSFPSTKICNNVPNYCEPSNGHASINIYYIKRHQGQSKDKAVDLASKLSGIQLEKSAASPALRLPQLFRATPNSSGKGGNTSKRLPEDKSIKQPFSNDHADNEGFNFLLLFQVSWILDLSLIFL